MLKGRLWVPSSHSLERNPDLVVVRPDPDLKRGDFRFVNHVYWIEHMCNDRQTVICRRKMGRSSSIKT
jgi:hypothetical protein